MNYLVLDPGEMTGWALFNYEGRPLQMGRLRYPTAKNLKDELNPWLDQITADTADLFVVEEYMLRTRNNSGRPAHYTPEWDRVYTARAIGAIERRAHELNVPIYWQYPSILPTAAQAFNLSLTKFRGAQHPVDAVLHGLYYAWKRLGILPPDRPVEESAPIVPETVVVRVDGLGDLRRAGRAVERDRKKQRRP